MERSVINESSIKLSLTKEEMKLYSIDCKRITADDSYAIKKLHSMLGELGFESEPGKVMIQAFGLSDGGCEMYLTRIDRHTDAVYRMLDLKSLLMLAKKLENGYKMPKVSFYRGNGEWYAVFADGEYPYYISDFAVSVSDTVGRFIKEHYDLLYCSDDIKELAGLADTI